MSNIRHAIARIYASSGAVAGAGFLVDESHVITCDHVLRAALLGHQVSDTQQSNVRLDFPLTRPASPIVQATPTLVGVDGGADIAGLTLCDPMPVGAEPVRLVTAASMWGHKFRAAGFPTGNANKGEWTTGRILDAIEGDWLQIDADGQVGRRVRRGYSGGPVWDETLQGTAGMVVAADDKDGDRVAFMIPAAILVRAWSDVLASRAISPSPYRGLHPFTEDTAHDFFGRTAVTAQIVDELHECNVLVLEGASGSGKSSILSAGVVPSLRGQGGWLIVRMRPGKDPVGALALALCNATAGGPNVPSWLASPTEIRSLISEDAANVAGEALLWSGEQRLLLIVDQAEELLTQCNDLALRREFVEALTDLVSGPRTSLPVNLVLGTRSDYHAALRDALPPELGPTIRTFRLEGMAQEQLREAIERPALKHDVRFETGLVEEILHDFNSRAGALPMLEFLLSLLWEGQDGRMLCWRSYEALGGVSGALTKHADRVLDRLSENDRGRARRVLLQLTGVATGATSTRRMLAEHEVRSGDWRVVHDLADSRLLCLDVVDDEEVAEFVHESLSWHWPLLNTWLEEEEAKLRASDERADQLSRRFAISAGVANLLPPPADTLAVGATFARMGQQMAKAYDCKVDRDVFRTAGTAMATGVLAVAGATWGGASLLKAIPGMSVWIGLLVQPPIVAAIGFAVANTWKHYFHVVSAGGRGPDNAELKEYVQLMMRNRLSHTEATDGAAAHGVRRLFRRTPPAAAG